MKSLQRSLINLIGQSQLRLYSRVVAASRVSSVSSKSPIPWPCPQCHSVNVKVVGPPEQLWPYVWARCEDCHEVWPAQETSASDDDLS